MNASTIIRLILCVFLLGFLLFYQIPSVRKQQLAVRKQQLDLDKARANYALQKIKDRKQRVRDSIETVRYCERADSLIRELKEVTRQFNVISRFPDNVTQKEYDEVMNQ